MNRFNIETELKFKISKEQFFEAITLKRIEAQFIYLIEQMWLYDNTKNNNKGNNKGNNKEEIPMKSRIRRMSLLEQGCVAEVLMSSHCTKYVIDNNSSIECEQEITSDEFYQLNDIGLKVNKKMIERCLNSVSLIIGV